MDRRHHHGHGAVGEVRTPMAWQHRDQLYQQSAVQLQQQGYQHPGDLPPRTASPLDTSNTSSLSSESQSRSNAHAHGRLDGHLPPTLPPLGPPPSLWEGEPYSVHYGPLGPLGMGMPPPMAMMMPPPGYSLPPMMLGPPPPMGPPAILLPPMMRPRPLVFPAAPTTPTPPEPLPVREPKSALLASLPPKEVLAMQRKKVRCCRGGCIVLWIIVGLILVGALLATALRFVVP